MRPASEGERRRLGETFAALCAVRSPSGEERAMADAVTARLRDVGLDVAEDDTDPQTGAGAGNLLARIPGRGPRTILLCAHLDTVPHPGVVEPVCEDGAWTSAGETILGADNKAAVAVLLELSRRCALEGSPVGLELLFTTSEERALAGAKAFDVSRLTAELGYVLDHASPIGEIVVASPTYYRVEVALRGKPAHAGIRPEDGRSAIIAAGRALTLIPHGRIDAETTANVGSIRGGVAGTNVVAEHCSFVAEVRSLDPAKAEATVARLVDAVYDAANEPEGSCDVDVVVEKLFDGYRHATDAPAVLAAEQAMRRCGHEPVRIVTGGGSDANAFEAVGLPCTNLANGTQANHETTERVTVAALDGMLDVVLELVSVLGDDA